MTIIKQTQQDAYQSNGTLGNIYNSVKNYLTSPIDSSKFRRTLGLTALFTSTLLMYDTIITNAKENTPKPSAPISYLTRSGDNIFLNFDLRKNLKGKGFKLEYKYNCKGDPKQPIQGYFTSNKKLKAVRIPSNCFKDKKTLEVKVKIGKIKETKVSLNKKYMLSLDTVSVDDTLSLNGIYEAFNIKFYKNTLDARLNLRKSLYHIIFGDNKKYDRSSKNAKFNRQINDWLQGRSAEEVIKKIKAYNIKHFGKNVPDGEKLINNLTNDLGVSKERIKSCVWYTKSGKTNGTSKETKEFNIYSFLIEKFAEHGGYEGLQAAVKSSCEDLRTKKRSKSKPLTPLTPLTLEDLAKESGKSTDYTFPDKENAISKYNNENFEQNSVKKEQSLDESLIETFEKQGKHEQNFFFNDIFEKKGEIKDSLSNFDKKYYIDQMLME